MSWNRGTDVERAPRIDTAAFARARGEAQGVTPLAAMPRLQAAGVEPEGMLEWRVLATRAADALERQRDFLELTIGFTPTMACARCLAPVGVAPIRVTTRFRFAPTERQAEIEDRDETEVEVIAHDAALDLAELVEDEAILGLPMMAAHQTCPSQSID